MTKALFFSVALICSIGISAQVQSPFPKPYVWLKAESVNDSLSQWTDLSGNNNHVLLSNEAGFSFGKMNFNPCVIIDTLQTALNINYQAKSSAELTVFAVYRPFANKNAYGIWAMQMDSASMISLSTQYIKDLRGKTTIYSDTTEDVALINMFRNKWTNKSVDSAFSVLKFLGNDSIPFKGCFSEFLFYDEPMAYNDIAKVYTYLAIKYGISIYRMDYLNSADEVIWKYSDNEEFANEVAGIGRDTVLGINQKQSCASAGNSVLTISAGELQESNRENSSLIFNHDFLIWSDNGSNFSFPDSIINSEFIPGVSERKWLMTCSGNTSNGIGTNIKIKSPYFNDSSFMILLINRETNFDFPVDGTLMFYPDNVDSSGNYYFSNIYWDIDGSGTDAFAFQYFNPEELLMATNENNSQTGNDTDAQDISEVIDPETSVNGNEPANGNDIVEGDAAESLDSGGDIIAETDIDGGKISDLKVYPNPCLGEFEIEALLEEVSDLKLTILDENSRVIEVVSLNGSDFYSTIRHIVVKGYYLIVAETSTESKSIKLIVQ